MMRCSDGARVAVESIYLRCRGLTRREGSAMLGGELPEKVVFGDREVA